MTRWTQRLTIGLAAGLMTLGAANAAFAQGRVPFESSGVTYEEIDQLEARANEYSFKLTLAAKGSGAYLSDVDVKIVSLPTHEVMLQHQTDGPLLMADLPPGRYEVIARYDDVLPGAAHQVRRVVNVPRSGLTRSIIYFDTGDQTADERRRR